MPEQVFNYTGANQTFVVPTWVSMLTVEMCGAQGGNTPWVQGGQGGMVQCSMPVTPGETLVLVAGGQNGFNGGGAAGIVNAGLASAVAGNGGGKSTIYRGLALWPSDVRAVAGGGGGAGGSSVIDAYGGLGGGLTGVAGSKSTLSGSGFGGGGGTPSAGGAAGSGGNVGTAGVAQTGGNGGPAGGWLAGPGGGGGGGWYGGGGGGGPSADFSTGGGGGGGSSYTASDLSFVTHSQGIRPGNGYIKLFWGGAQTTAPTNVTPGSGSIVDTNTPTLGATIVAEGTSRQRVEWHISTSSDFLNNLRIIAEPTSDLKVSGATTEPVPLASKLSQGAWYIRARTLDEGGAPSPYSSTQQFTVAHAPSASPVSPSSGQTIAWSANGLSLSWLFSDPSPDDSQLAYQVIVTNTATGSSVADTGKTPSLSKIATVSIPDTSKNAVLSWRVRVWDQDDIAGNYTNPVVFTVGDAPGIVVATMTTVATSSPTIAFTFTPIGAPLATYRVTITRDSDSSQVYDSGWVSGT